MKRLLSLSVLTLSALLCWQSPGSATQEPVYLTASSQFFSVTGEPMAPGDLINVALDAMENGNYVDAYRLVNAVIKSNPAWPSGYHTRGLILLSAGDPAGAIDDFTYTIRLEQRFPTAYFNRGVAYLQIGNKPKALEDFKKAALLYRQMGASEHASDAIQKIRELMAEGYR
ncbi:MAG: tetratricopeptide repeat protein [Leptolyngbyaceae cyanobacterium bins.59]|nr:tetratricopeptide repeat protein [Leptolyngbyaceae cyanobacterium bins.59]